MNRIGLVSNIVKAVESVARGRRGFATEGKETEGGIYFRRGISQAHAVFQEAGTLADPEIIALVEQAFLQQELAFCDEGDKNAYDSLSQALQSFDDAFLCREVIDEPSYIAVEKSHPHSRKYRIQGFPKDAFHIACLAHPSYTAGQCPPLPRYQHGREGSP
ncbi:MAG: hypothetical protein LBK61_12360 [Spirochaetaceae bacterium]|nr:hypothetical protein [Spirochaetaceae bacterium]